MLGFPVFGIASGALPPSDGVLDTSAQCFGAFEETNWLEERAFLDPGSDYGTREAESADYELQRSLQTLLPTVAGTKACPVPSAVWILTATRFQRLRPCSTCSGRSTSSAATRWTSNQCRLAAGGTPALSSPRARHFTGKRHDPLLRPLSGCQAAFVPPLWRVRTRCRRRSPPGRTIPRLGTTRCWCRRSPSLRQGSFRP